MKEIRSTNEVRELTISICEASCEDIEGILHVNRESWLATYPNKDLGITREDIQTAVENRRPIQSDRWHKTIESESENKHTWVAKDENKKVIGFCFAIKSAQENKIQAIYVLPGLHGKGVGQQLITQALQWLGSAKPVTLNVASYNIKAINFYKKIGFEESDDVLPSPAAALPSGKIIPEIKMVLRRVE